MLTTILIVLAILIGLPTLVSLVLGLVYLLGMFHIFKKIFNTEDR